MEDFVYKNQKKLRKGITTGTCAAAAAKAAAAYLLCGIEKEQVQIVTPSGKVLKISVNRIVPWERSLEDGAELFPEKQAEFMVVKDSGDDPDVTDQAEIHVSIQKVNESFRPVNGIFQDAQNPGLFLDGGAGVGRVTKEGLEQSVGAAAINTVPRAMIFGAVDEVCRMAEFEGRLLITVSVPQGESLAKKTFNPMLGIEGGISILGTSGILEPMSEKAIVDTIETLIRQKHAMGKKDLLVTPGNYGQSYITKYLNLPLEDSVKCSNYVGDTIDLAISYGMKNFLLVGNLGKLVKLGAGIMNTHSKTADGRFEILSVHTVLCGGNREMVKRLMECINTDQALELLEQWGLKEAVMNSLCQKIEEHLERRSRGEIKCAAILFSEKYGFLGQTSHGEELLELFRSKVYEE